MAAPTPRERLGDLFAKVDAFFDRAAHHHGALMTCHSGCNDCCHRRFTVTSLEAAALADAVSALDPAARAELSARARGGDPGVCPVLDASGRCAVYAARPLICRTHGLPIRFSSAISGSAPGPSEAPRQLPVLDACPRNFTGQPLDTLAPGTILDQTTLSTILGALDAAHADAEGRPRGERIAITDVLTATHPVRSGAQGPAGP
ncbi:YkgJ family cysteine cluster protein [Chondromyces apiculatus]|uniref:Fe-S-cluster oxidoreductase n=1 Tax=Chondromyces apiculatus DSM 436 TaxID=1192034 RepID=A0A017TF93_9BACT|nr:YkgJ family cysteine cluster protein [Chondromyces apiculatus]EYF07552.1 Hypothetical protein CAP_8675 [Chondromyces apiculatus DSM 436]